MSTTKPAAAAVWDTNGTNSSAPTSGHKTDGYALSEVPTSTEFNGQMNLVGQWSNYENVLMTNGGGAVGQMDLGNAAEATVSPLDLRRDYLGNRRSLVDHNGYRMGQVTEKDETWDVGAQPAVVPIVAGQSTSANWNFNSSVAQSWFWSTTGAISTLEIPVDGMIPAGAIVTSVQVKLNRANTSDSTTLFWTVTTGGVGSAQINKTISSGTGITTVDMLVAPAGGHGPLQYQNPSSPGDSTVIAIGGTNTAASSLTIYGIQITYVVPPIGWSWTQATANQISATVGDQFAIANPQSGLNQRGLQLLSTAITVAGASVLNPGWETYHDANCAYAIEFMVRAGTITDGSAHRLFQLGVQNNNAGLANRFVSFYTDNTFANWQLQVVGSSTTNTDTGVAVAAATVYRMRLEIYGASVNSSGLTKIRAYINGSKVAEVNVSTLPSSDMIRPYFKVGTNGTTGGPYDVTIGRVRRAWNHLLAGDNL